MEEEDTIIIQVIFKFDDGRLYNFDVDRTTTFYEMKKILSNAEDMGADFLVTSCPLCRYNLIKNKGDSKLDVIYFTELLAEALGIKEAK